MNANACMLLVAYLFYCHVSTLVSPDLDPHSMKYQMAYWSNPTTETNCIVQWLHMRTSLLFDACDVCAGNNANAL